MFDEKTAVSLALRMCSHAPADPETALATSGIDARRAVAARVAECFPAFSSVVSLMETTEAAEGVTSYGSLLVREFEAIQRFSTDHEVLANVDFLVLFAGMLGLMERFEEPANNDARIVLCALELISAEVADEDGAAMVLMAYWFADYREFRAALRARLKGR